MRRIIVLLSILFIVSCEDARSLPSVAEPATLLTFVAPTQNTDGSLLTDLAGYKVYWRLSTSDPYIDADSATFSNPALTEITIINIGINTDGDYLVVMTAYNQAAAESEFSNEAHIHRYGGVFYKTAQGGGASNPPTNLSTR